MATSNGNEAIEVHSISFSFEFKKQEMLQGITNVITNGEELWHLLQADQETCNKLVIQQVLVSNRYSDFHDIWKHMDVCPQNPNFSKLLEINEHMNYINDVLTDFENNTHATNKTLQELRDAFMVRNCELNSVLRRCVTSSEMEQLENLRIPDFSGIETDSYCDMRELSREWDDFDFNTKLDVCFEGLRSLSVIKNTKTGAKRTLEVEMLQENIEPLST